jgi:hypothetical protein
MLLLATALREIGRNYRAEKAHFTSLLQLVSAHLYMANS